MNDYVIMPKADYQGACDAIRAKTGKTDLIKSGDMATEIEEIKTGGGGSSVSPKDVNFYDYDGTLLHSYTLEEAQALTELPPLPEQEGLICQGWNWTLDDIKAENKETDVGATYITDDGKTRLYIHLNDERLDVPLSFRQIGSADGVIIDWGDGSATETLGAAGDKKTIHTYPRGGDYVITLDPLDGCSILFGDTIRRPIGGDIETGSISYYYANTLKKVELGKNVYTRKYAFQLCQGLETITIPNGSYGNPDSSGQAAWFFKTCPSLRGVVIPSGATRIEDSSFQDCCSLSFVSIPKSVTSVSHFQNCYAISRVTLPNTAKSLGSYLLSNCHNLERFAIPNTVTSISNGVLSGCYSLSKLTIPNSVTKILESAFYNCVGVKYYDFTALTAVPTLSNKSAFSYMQSDCEIRVPASLYEEWIAKTNWSALVDNIVAV